MANEMEKKRLGWFKNPLSNQHEVEQSQDEPSEPVVEELPKESEKEEQPEKENVQQIDSNESIIFLGISRTKLRWM